MTFQEVDPADGLSWGIQRSWDPVHACIESLRRMLVLLKAFLMPSLIWQTQCKFWHCDRWWMACSTTRGPSDTLAKATHGPVNAHRGHSENEWGSKLFTTSATVRSMAVLRIGSLVSRQLNKACST